MSLLKLLGWADAQPAPERLAATIQASPDRPVAGARGVRRRVRRAPGAGGATSTAASPRPSAPCCAPLLAANAGLPPAEAETVIEIVTHQASTLEGISYASLTRAFNAIATAEEKERLIDCLFAVATAEGSISLVEDEECARSRVPCCSPTSS